MKMTTLSLAIAICSTVVFGFSAASAAETSANFCHTDSCFSEFNKLEKLAYFGSGQAATIVAIAYATGEGTEQDIDKARSYMLKAAMRWREPMAMHQMSVWLRQGFVFEKNISKADTLLDRAVRAKFAPALTDKAKLLLAQDIPQADEEAIALLEQANELNSNPGRYLLAQLLASGVATKPDLARAGQLYKSLALRSYADSRQQLNTIIRAIEDVQQQSVRDADAELQARIQPVLADLKQIDDIEHFKVYGQKFDPGSEFSSLVARLTATQVFNRENTGSRIPGNICGRGSSTCKSVFNRQTDIGFGTVSDYLGMGR